MRYNTGRNLDTTARGLGGVRGVPVTSCCEENILMHDTDIFPTQSILVHEFGHAVMNLGLGKAQNVEICQAYHAAVSKGLYPKNCYMMCNDQEYWAIGTATGLPDCKKTHLKNCI